jgi:glutathione S-transferase
MALEIFWTSGSAACERVLLTLAVKGVSYASRPIRLSRREQRQPDFLAINPRGKVPVLRDGALVLRESIAIMAYLDRCFPEPPLFGTNAEEHGQTHCFIGEHESYFRPAMLGVVRPILHGAPGAIAERAGEIRSAAAALRDELGRLDAALADRQWLVGARLGAADLAIYPDVELVMRAGARPAAERLDLGLGDRWPNVAAWRARLAAACPRAWSNEEDRW